MGRGRSCDTGAVTVRSPMVVTHFRDGSLTTADLTVYAELHNATALPMKGVVSRALRPAFISSSRSSLPRMKTRP